MNFPTHPSIAECGHLDSAVDKHPQLAPGTMLIPNRGLWSWTVDPSPEKMFTLSPGTILYSAGVYADPSGGGYVLSSYMIDYAETVDDGVMHFDINKVGMAVTDKDGSTYAGPLTGNVIGEAARSGALQAMKIEGQACWSMRINPSDIVYMDSDISVEGEPEDVEIVDADLVMWAQDQVAERWKVITGTDADVTMISLPTVPASKVAELREKGWRVPSDGVNYVFALRDPRLPSTTHFHVNFAISDLTVETIDKALRNHLKRFAPSEAELEAAQAILARAEATAQ